MISIELTTESAREFLIQLLARDFKSEWAEPEYKTAVLEVLEYNATSRELDKLLKDDN